jgi:TetR/AcrR family transcriptional repressor of nem operon
MKSATRSGPGRPREFDEQEAVQNALAVFRARGYAATSLPDLIEGTQLSRGSLYKAFGDKHQLFLAALDFYIERGIARLTRNLRHASARASLHEALRHYVRLSVGLEGLAGCPVTAAATECLPFDERVKARVAGMFERMQSLLAATIRHGQAAGELAADQNADDLARFLLCMIEGMRVLGKTDCGEAAIQAIAEIALGAIR